MKKLITILATSVIATSLFATCYELVHHRCGGRVRLTQACRGLGTTVSCWTTPTGAWDSPESGCGRVSGNESYTRGTNFCSFDCTATSLCFGNKVELHSEVRPLDAKLSGDACSVTNVCAPVETGGYSRVN